MSEMGLVHFPGPDQPNPNPVCSDIALQLADAVASELGDIAGRFFKVVEAGKIEASELGSFAAMKPTNLQPGSLEHALLKDVLLGVNDPRSEEHTSELQSLMRNSYAVFCLKQKTTPIVTAD